MRGIWLTVGLLVVVFGGAFVWLQAPPSHDARERVAEVLRDPAPPGEPAAYAHCASCHLHDGTGRPDGSIPRLNGQRRAVLERKLHRIRSGEVRLPAMDPFARTLSPTEISEVSAYLAGLPESAPAAVAQDPNELRAGAEAYGARCASCHGTRGEGHDGLGASRLCGQYQGYLARRLDEIGSNARGTADAIMLGVLTEVPPEALPGIVAWLASGEACRP